MTSSKHCMWCICAVTFLLIPSNVVLISAAWLGVLQQAPHRSLSSSTTYLHPCSPALTPQTLPRRALHSVSKECPSRPPGLTSWTLLTCARGSAVRPCARLMTAQTSTPYLCCRYCRQACDTSTEVGAGAGRETNGPLQPWLASFTLQSPHRPAPLLMRTSVWQHSPTKTAAFAFAPDFYPNAAQLLAGPGLRQGDRRLV